MRKFGVLLTGLIAAAHLTMSASTPATAGTQIAVQPFASKDDTGLGFQALFPKERLVVQMNCSAASRECFGSQLSLTGIEAGKGLRFLDLGGITNARLTHVSEHETQIEWGVNHFTIDFETGAVAYNTMIGSCRAHKAPAKPPPPSVR